MEDEGKAKKQLISDVVEMRQGDAALNATKTERRQAGAALRESEARFRNLLDYIPGVSIQGYTADGIVRYWNKASEEVYGYTEEEAIGRNLGDLIIPPEVKPHFKQALELGAKCTKSGEFMPPGELMLLHKNGSLVPVYSIHTVVCLSGRPHLMFCIDVDLSERKRTEEALRKAHNELERRVEERTAELAKVVASLRKEIEERKRAEEALRESEKRYFLATSAGSVGVWDWNLDTNEIHVDPMLKAFLGYEDHEIRNHIEDWGKRVHPADRERVMAEATKHLEGLSLHYEIEHRMVHKDGSIRWFLARGTAMQDKSGRPYRMLGTDTDITERKRAEESLRLREAILQAVAYAAEHFLKATSWEDDVDLVLARLGQAAEVSRVYVFENHTDAAGELLVSQRYEWVASGVTAQLDNPDMRGISWRSGAMRRAAEILGSGGFVSGHVRDFLPAEQKMMSAQDIQSMVVVPIFADGEWWGFMGFDECVREREWSAAEIDALKAGVSTLGAAIHGKRSEEALRKSYTEIEQLKDRLQAESEYLRAEIKLDHSHGEIVGESEAIKRVLLQLEQVAPTESSVLITGETGTGKELIARAIHNLSKRKDRVMVKVDCASLPSALVESELFGRQKGAYTGALTSQVGRFEVADGSSIFLDEIGELSPELQVKLLRVLQEGEFERLGSPKTIRVNVRVIAATNRDLSAEVRKGNFREDLYYRLNVFHIEVPPLRERLDDIPRLVWTFANEFAEKMGKKIQTVPKRTMEALQRYHWPGNVRELRNIIEHAVIISASEILKVQLPQDPRGVTSRILTLKDAERQHITKVLDRTNWRIKGPHGAAELLGLKPSTLYTKMTKLGIPTSRNKDAIPT